MAIILGQGDPFGIAKRASIRLSLFIKASLPKQHVGFFNHSEAIKQRVKVIFCPFQQFPALRTILPGNHIVNAIKQKHRDNFKVVAIDGLCWQSVQQGIGQTVLQMDYSIAAIIIFACFANKLLSAISPV